MALTFLIAFAVTFFGNSVTPPDFLGLRVGMNAATALTVIHRNGDAIKHVKDRSGQRVITDTLTVSGCELAMKRSLGFDSTNTLTAIGLTYKTTPDRMEDARDCAFQWLKKIYGPPSSETTTDNIKQELWQYEGAKLSLEAKKYNSHDVFVLIYYYKAENNG